MLASVSFGGGRPRGIGADTVRYFAQAGANVVMLEAGPAWYASRGGATMMTPIWMSPRRGAATRTRPFGEFDACDGGWEVEGEPYTRAEGTTFDWWRARMLGGRTNHWGRISLRFGPDDFRGKSIDGLGDDWPISYDDVAPYYDRVDDLVGIFEFGRAYQTWQVLTNAAREGARIPPRRGGPQTSSSSVRTGRRAARSSSSHAASRIRCPPPTRPTKRPRRETRSGCCSARAPNATA